MPSWDHLFDGEDDEAQEVFADQMPASAPRRGPGRPPGRKTQPKESLLSKKQLMSLYNRFEPFLTDDQKQYIQGVMDGQQSLDTTYEMTLLVRSMALIFQEAAMVAFGERKVTKELSDFSNSLRMAIKDLDDMNRREEEKKQKQQVTDDLVRVTERRATVETLEALLSEHSPSPTPRRT